MKNIFKTGLFALITLLGMVACSPQDSTDYKLGPMPTADQLDFTISPSGSTPNVMTLTNTSRVAGVAVWDMGNGSTAKGESVTAEYPFSGEYVITMSLYTTGGSVSISKTIAVADNDETLLDTPFYNALTGGLANTAGKTWVFDRENDGHFGVGPDDGTSPSWWSCEANGKATSSLYTQEFTFILEGVQMLWKNNGYVYTNENGLSGLAEMGYPNSKHPEGDSDYDVEMKPTGPYTFMINESAKTITLSNNAFFGHYAGVSTYEIVTLTDTELYIKCVSTAEPGNAWWYRFVPKQ